MFIYDRLKFQKKKNTKSDGHRSISGQLAGIRDALYIEFQYVNA